MAKLARSEVLHIGKLAALDLTEPEIEKFSSQLADILEFVEKVNQVKAERVSPLFNVTAKKNVAREDKVEPSLKQEEALTNAKSTYRGFFKVKAVMEKKC